MTDIEKIKEYLNYHGDVYRSSRKIYAAFGGKAYAVRLTDGRGKKEYCAILTQDMQGDFTEFDNIMATSEEDVEQFILDFEKEEREQEGEMKREYYE